MVLCFFFLFLLRNVNFKSLFLFLFYFFLFYAVDSKYDGPRGDYGLRLSCDVL